MTDMQKKNRNLVGEVPEGGVVMEGHQQLGAQQAVTGLLRPYIQPLALLELADTQLHHSIIHLRTPSQHQVKVQLCLGEATNNSCCDLVAWVSQRAF